MIGEDKLKKTQKNPPKNPQKPHKKNPKQQNPGGKTISLEKKICNIINVQFRKYIQLIQPSGLHNANQVWFHQSIFVRVIYWFHNGLLGEIAHPNLA